MVKQPLPEQRVDKWLWIARFYKTRSQATVAVKGGRVSVDGQRVKPSKLIRVDSNIQINKRDDTFDIHVRGIGRQRGPANEAILLYEERAESISLRETVAEARHTATQLRAERAGRPNKRDRRRLLQLKSTPDPKTPVVTDS